MECYSLNVFERDSGSVWQNKCRSGLKTPGAPLLSVNNKCHCYEANVCKGARFVQVVVDHTGKRLAAGDRHGNVYLFHLDHNRFWLITKLPSCSTAMAFTPLEERDLLLATANCSLHVFESSKRSHIAHLAGHPTCISSISVDKEGRRFLTCSLKRALVWDLLTLGVLHQLNFHVEENLIKCIFVPPGATFLTALKDERILGWSSSTFEYTYQLKTLTGSAIRTLDISSDGHLLAAGGRASWLYVWRLWDSLGEGEEPSVLSMGAAGVVSIRHLAFMAPSGPSDPRTSTHILGVVSHEGVLHFYEVETQTHLVKVELSEDSITTFRAAAYHSWKFAALTFSGKMLLYNLDNILMSSSTVGLAAGEGGEVQHVLAKAGKERARNVLPEGYSSNKNLSDTTVSQLKGILREYGQYPDKYRYLIWRSLLFLPNKGDAFKKLSSLPPLNVFKSLHLTYPVTNTTDYRALQRILSLLCHWCPRLAEIPDLPLLVFPFVKLFHQNLHLCFELLITFISNWCQNWWTYYPSAPFRILTAVESILSHHDPMLLLHFIRHGISAEIYGWILLKTVFSEVVSKENWLNLFDHVLSNPPSFLLYLVVAFNILCRKLLTSASTAKEFETVFRNQQATITVRDLTKKAYVLRQRTPANIREACIQAFGSFAALMSTGDAYPSFSNFPSIGINAAEENKKAQEKIDYVKSRQDKFLNMQATEKVTRCQCFKDLPQTFRSDTCACVRVPPSSYVLPLPSPAPDLNTNPKVVNQNSSHGSWKPGKFQIISPEPGNVRELPGTSVTLGRKLEVPQNYETAVTDVIRRVMETRRKLSQQTQEEL